MESPEGSPKRTWLKEREQSNYVESVRRNTLNGILLETGTMIRNLGMVRSMDTQTMGELIIGQYQLAAGRGNFNWIGQMQRAATQFMSTSWIVENIPQRDPKKNIRPRTSTQREHQAPDDCRDFRLQEHPSLPVLRVIEQGNTQPLTTETHQEQEVSRPASEERSDTRKVVSDTHKVLSDSKKTQDTQKVHSKPSAARPEAINKVPSESRRERSETYKVMRADSHRERSSTHKVQDGAAARGYLEQESWRGQVEYRTRSPNRYDSRETPRYREQESWRGQREYRTRSPDWYDSRETPGYREQESWRGQVEYRTRSPNLYDSRETPGYREQESWRGQREYRTLSPDQYDARETQGYREQESWRGPRDYRTHSPDWYYPIETQVYTRTPVHDRDLDAPPQESKDRRVEQSWGNHNQSSRQAPEVLVEPSDLVVHVRQVEVRPKRKLLDQDHGGKTVKKHKVFCPVHGCDHQTGKMKWHVYMHLPKEFTIYSTRDKPEEEFLDRCRIVGLQYLATAILGPRSTLGDLLRFANDNWDPYERYAVSPEVEEAIRRVHAKVGRGTLYRIVLSPANSVACLLHWRPLAFLYNHLSRVQREGFEDACSSPRPQGSNPTVGAPSTGSLALTEDGPEVNTPEACSQSASQETQAEDAGDQSSPMVTPKPTTGEMGTPDCDPGMPTELLTMNPTPEMGRADTVAPDLDRVQPVSKTLADLNNNSISLEAPTLTDVEMGTGGTPTETLPTSDQADQVAETEATVQQDDQKWTLVTSQKRTEKATGKTYAGVAAGSFPTPSDQIRVHRKTDPSLPKAFDSHFHLDRLNLRLTETITSVEDAFDVDVGYGPEHRVALSGGVLVFCDPERYDELVIPNDPRWRVAVGIHPKKAPSFRELQWVHMQVLLSDNRVTAVGEVGLDYSVPQDQWPIQEQVLKKVLTVCGLGHVLVLHIRGNKRDPCGIQPHARCLEIVQHQCSRYQRIHIHCFTGDLKISSKWRNIFPNCCFGYTGLVKRFNLDQRCAVAQLPLDRIIIETDSPYMEIHSGQTVNTPAYIGDVAKAVADLRMMPVAAVLQATDQNGRALYGCRKAY